MFGTLQDITERKRAEEAAGGVKKSFAMSSKQFRGWCGARCPTAMSISSIRVGREFTGLTLERNVGLELGTVVN